MRLWHYKLVEAGLLPQSQLVGQWRELNSIFRNQPKHILINYVYEYPKNDLYTYSLMVIKELTKRGYHITKFDNFYEYFGLGFGDGNTLELVDVPFKNHHDLEYLEICCYNLKEKQMRGQEDFTNEMFLKINDFVLSEILGGADIYGKICEN